MKMKMKMRMVVVGKEDGDEDKEDEDGGWLAPPLESTKGGERGGQGEVSIGVCL